MCDGSIFAGGELQPCDIPLMVEKNRRYLEALADTAIARVRKYYEEYKDKADLVWCSFSGGKDSMVLLDIVQRALPHNAFKVFFTDTRMEFPDTYDYIDRIRVWCADRNIDFVTCSSDMHPEQSWHVPASLYRLTLHTDISNLQLGTSRSVQCEVTVNIGNCTSVCTCHLDGSTDNRAAILRRGNLTRDLTLRKCHARTESKACD